MAEVADLNISDGNNTARWPSGTMTINQIDDAGRALEGMIARDYKDSNGSNTTTGSGAAYVLTLNRSGVTSLANIGQITVRAHVANTGAATINVNSLGAKAITKRGGAALVVGDILLNDIITLAYNPSRDNFQLMGI
jgi:hypothetical protein